MWLGIVPGTRDGKNVAEPESGAEGIGWGEAGPEVGRGRVGEALMIFRFETLATSKNVGRSQNGGN